MRRKMEAHPLRLCISLFVLATLRLADPGAGLRAQNFSEWFKQKKTQKKYLLLQIAALQAYAQAIERGYAIAKSGLSTVARIKAGDFMTHSLHFSRLEAVSPAVKAYTRVTAIAALADRSERLLAGIVTEKELPVLLTDREMTQVRQTADQVQAAVNSELKQLQLLLTDGALEMSTDERIKAIDRLYGEAEKRWRATRQFVRNIRALISARKEQGAGWQVLESLYGKE